MSVRPFGQTGTAVVLLMLVTGAFLLAGRAPLTAVMNQAAGWRAPRTPWGHPDLQGVWTTTGMRFVPLERPRRFGTRAVLTDRELAQRVALNPDRGETITPGVAERTPQMSRQASLVVSPADGRIPLTPVAVEELEKRERDFRIDNPERSSAGTGELTHYELSGGPLFRNHEAASAADNDLWDRCITRGFPGVMVPTAYNNALQIIQTPDHVVIWYELLTKRIVPLDGRPPLDRTIRQWDGDARGRWEGETLVVETTNFRETRAHVRQYGSFDGGSKDMRTVERFTRVDANTITYEGTVIDPALFSMPWTLSFPLEKNEAYRLFEYACHEGNYSMSLRLSGARASERDAETKGLTPARDR